MTWRRIWFWTLLAVFLVWLGLEVDSIVVDHGGAAYTLSDTIRDWQVLHPWLRWAVGIAFLGLWVHFFLQRNPK